MRISAAFLPLVAATLLIAGCGDKEPATSSVAQAEAALENVRVEGSQFSAPELALADATLANMKANLAKEDYRAVITDVPKFNTEMRTLKESIVSRQTLAVADQREWETLNQEMPKVVEEIQVRVANLQGAKLPKEITKETFETAKTELETIKATWAEATAAAAAGNTTEAATKGRTVQVKAEKLKTDLGMTADPALASIAAPASGTN